MLPRCEFRRKVTFYFIFHGCSNKTYASLESTLPTPIMIKQRQKKAVISLRKRFFGPRNSLSPYIYFQRVVMFAPWRSQKSLRKHKDPIAGNSFIGLHKSNKDHSCYYYYYYYYYYQGIFKGLGFLKAFQFHGEFHVCIM